jgi:hypothetical protein
MIDRTFEMRLAPLFERISGISNKLVVSFKLAFAALSTSRLSSSLRAVFVSFAAASLNILPTEAKNLKVYLFKNPNFHNIGQDVFCMGTITNFIHDEVTNP